MKITCFSSAVELNEYGYKARDMVGFDGKWRDIGYW